MLALALTALAIAAPLPDLDQATPFGLSVVRHGGRSMLIFGSAVDNVGRAPLIVVGRRLGGRMRTWQLVGGRWIPLAVRLRYVHSETHQHWHFPGFERYELRRLDGTLAGRDRKTGFCLRDAYETRPLGLPPVWTGECASRRPDAAIVRQGISPGFGDDYVPLKEGQSIDVTGLRGRFVLVHRTNPQRVLRERSYANNAASVQLDLRHGRATILRRCPRARPAEPDSRGRCRELRQGGTMRKLSALAVLAALLAAPTALAKERNMTMTALDVAPKAGQPWLARIRVVMDGHPASGLGPMVRIVSPAGKTVFIPSRRTPTPGIYVARIVFPTAGSWRVIAVDRYSGRSYEFKRVTVRAA